MEGGGGEGEREVASWLSGDGRFCAPSTAGVLSGQKVRWTYMATMSVCCCKSREYAPKLGVGL